MSFLSLCAISALEVLETSLASLRRALILWDILSSRPKVKE